MKRELKFINGNGKLVIQMNLANGIPSLTFYDPLSSQQKIKVCLEEVSTYSYPAIYLYDKKGNQRVSLSVLTTDEGYLVFFGPDPNSTRFKVNCEPNFGTRLYLGYEKDKWLLLQSHLNDSELLVRHKQWQSHYGVVVK